MKNIYLYLSVLFMLVSVTTSAQIYSTKDGKIDFFSKTPVEDIEAHSGVVVVLLNTKTNDVVVQVNNTSFQFPNKLMQEHFNEKYMESEQYPTSTFKGKIAQVIDYSKNGTYDVTVTGTLTIHGVTKERTIPGKLIVKDGTIQLLADFMVKVVDHNIQVPKLVVAKIAEEISVHIDAVLKPRQ